LRRRALQPYLRAMSAFFLSALLLSVAAYIHTRSEDPVMRPAHPIADLFWRGLSYLALAVWALMILRGFYTKHWADALAALLGSFAVNWWFGHRGPKPTWPGISMMFGVVGLGLAAYSYLYE
jgi:hypothetical protein